MLFTAWVGLADGAIWLASLKGADMTASLTANAMINRAAAFFAFDLFHTLLPAHTAC